MTFSIVDKPINIGGVDIKNRAFRSAHATNLGGGVMSDELIAYHEARARGGIGLSIIEILSVHPSTPWSLNIFDPDIDRGYEKLVEVIRPTGMRLFQQLWHGGHNALTADGSPPWSASDIASPMIGVVPVAMTKAMIDEIVASYADAARRCRDWGLDGVEVHASHGYLISQFLSPLMNRREDDYGGSFENRVRFLTEIMIAIREATPGFAAGVRLAPDATTGGVGPDGMAEIARWLTSQGLVDFVNVSIGSYHSFPRIIGGMHEPVGYELPTSLPVARAAEGVVRMVIGRFRTLEEADQILREGEVDMIGMTRATIADPDLVAKSLSGRAEEVRPCIACNQGCIGNLLGPAGRMACVVNPGTGAELMLGDRRIEPCSTPRNVFVVGGGPAGMEAARVAALRGHRVKLFEAQPRLGGALRLASMAPTRHGMADILDWMEREIYRHGVEVQLSTYVDADELLDEGPDAVIVATGSQPRMDGVQLSNPGEVVTGMEQPHVLSSHELFEGTRKYAGTHAVVVDDLGHFEAIAVAEKLMSQGFVVSFISRHNAFAPLVETAQMTEPALQRLSRGEFSVRLRSRLVAIEEERVLVAPIYLDPGSNHTESIPANVVVFVSFNRSNREIYDDLQGKIDVKVVGDANSPRFLQAAIHEGHVAGFSV